MKLTVNEWGDGYERSGISVCLKKSDGKEINLNISDGEKEDMVMARDLSDVSNVPSMIIAAFNAGKNGEKLEIIYEENED